MISIKEIAFWKNLFKKYDRICIGDGSRFQDPTKGTIPGIGGLIEDNLGNMLYLFTGPAQATDILQIEIKALEFLI